MTFAEFYFIFGLGLVSSLHCVQMCGVLVISYSLPLSKVSRTTQVFAHLSYNFGRILTYTMLGTVAGFIGGTIGFVGSLAGIENAAAIIGGCLMIVAGFLMLNLLPQTTLQRFDPLRLVSGFLRPMGCRISSPTVISKFILGLMLGFLPCGLIYAALLKAMASGSALNGALTMLAYGLGTVSALMTVGLFSSSFHWQFGRWGNRLAAISITFLGVFLLWRGLMPLLSATGQAASHHHQ